MQPGDWVETVLDTNQGILYFLRVDSEGQSEPLLTAYDGLAGLTLYPAFALYSKGDRLSVRKVDSPNSNYSRFSSDGKIPELTGTPLVPSEVSYSYLSYLADSCVRIIEEGTGLASGFGCTPQAALLSQW